MAVIRDGRIKNSISIFDTNPCDTGRALSHVGVRQALAAF